SFSSLFLIGLLNGLLPCGLVYIAIAGSIGSGSALMGAIYMALFGLGTMPMLLAINLSGGFISTSLRKKINKLIPILVIIVGILFILRGLSLGIPYISPSEEKIKMKYEKSLKEHQPPAKSEMHDCCKPTK
ncbi:MAG TPA: sulfite exporter TauE/SafE family protein, partial [Bacteroidales bacterium]|nr:sulfite exporter TauE/SafE family protein [Bacteroidales bacterium]